MRIRFLGILVLALLVTGLTGCRLINGGSSDGPNVVKAPTSNTVVSTIVRRPVAGGSSVRGVNGSIRAVAQTEVVKGARVTLTLSDGTRYTMTDDGNGKYTATVSNIEGAKGFVIEAHKGDLVVQNLVTDLKNTDLANLETNHLTTAFTQIALAFAKNEGTIQLASVEDLIKNVTAINIDLTTLRKEVTDETNVTYDLQRQFFTVGLTSAKLDAAEGTPTLLDKLASGELKPTIGGTQQTWTDVIVKPIDDGTITPPVVPPADDETALKELATSFLNLFAKAMSGTAITPSDREQLTAMLGEDFIMNGQTKNTLLANLDSIQDAEDQYQFVSFSGQPVFRKIDATTYLVGFQGTVTEKNKTTNVNHTFSVDSFKDGYAFDSSFATYRRTTLDADDLFPMIAKKFTDGKWRLLGNGIKVSQVNMNLHFARWNNLPNSSSNDNTYFWFEVKDTTAFPVTKIEISGGKITETITLSKVPDQDDSNKWRYWGNGTTGSDKHPTNYPVNGWPLTGNGSVTHANGDEYTFVVTYQGEAKQTFKFQVAGLTSNYQPLAATVTPGDTGVTVAWPKNTFADFENYEVAVDAPQESGFNRILKQEIRNPDQLNVSFNYQTSAYQLVPGSQINVMIHSWRKVGIAQSFSQTLTVPLFGGPANALKGIAEAVKALGFGSARLPSFAAPPANPSPSIRAFVNPVPKSTVWPYTGWSFFMASDPSDTDSFTAIGNETNCFAYTSGTYDSNGIYPILRLFTSDGQIVAYDEASLSPWQGIPAKLWLRALFNKQVNGGQVTGDLKTFQNNQETIPLQNGFTPLFLTGNATFTGSIGGTNRSVSLGVQVSVEKPETTQIANGWFNASISIGNDTYEVRQGEFDTNGLKNRQSETSNAVYKNDAKIGRLGVNSQGQVTFTMTGGAPQVL